MRINLPSNYVVAATGELQNDEEKKWMLWRENYLVTPGIKIKTAKKNGVKEKIKINPDSFPPSALQVKSLRFIQNKIHDFAWFADKRYLVNHDTLDLASGRTVDVWSYYLPTGKESWKNSTRFIKEAVRKRSEWVGEYPFNVVSAAEANMGVYGGMEYPTITSISPIASEKELDLVIEHEVGHNWFYGIIGTNERRYPWMDEGINTFYDNRYEVSKYQTADVVAKSKNSFLAKRVPEKLDPLVLKTYIAVKKDQPINTSAEDFSEANYGLIAYDKAAQWMEKLESYLGKQVFDSCMAEYYNRWKFKHPYPEDFKAVLESVSKKDLNFLFADLDKKGPLNTVTEKRKLAVTGFFNLKNTDNINYISVAPAIGYNNYDKLMLGLLIHNYNLPFNRFQFAVVPLYATNTKTWNGIGQVNYNWFNEGKISKVVAAVNGSSFSTLAGPDSTGNKITSNFYKLVPSIKIFFRQRPTSQEKRWVEFRTYLIGEKEFSEYEVKSTDSLNYPVASTHSNRYINQLTYGVQNSRALYPYSFQAGMQQGAVFYRAFLNASYFLNYRTKGGMKVRFTAVKFGYLGGKSIEAFLYQPKLLGVNGKEDYTYSNYFIGRSAATNISTEQAVRDNSFAARQIMIRDGALKLRIDELGYLQGQSENWIAAVNFNTTIPDKLIPLPVKLPLKIFLDIGTYDEAWRKEAPTSRFLYVGGLQLSLFKNIVNIYAPLMYNKEIRDAMKSYPAYDSFWKKITFSIDFQNLKLNSITKDLPL